MADEGHIEGGEGIDSEVKDVLEERNPGEFQDGEGEGAIENALGEGEEYDEEGEYMEDEYLDEQYEGEIFEGRERDKLMNEVDELMGELKGEEEAGGEEEEREKQPEKVEEEVIEEEEEYVEEPVDPSAPYDFSDSKEALKAPFQLRPDQMAEIEQLWELYQNYTPAYTDLENYITEVELVYMMKCLLVLPFTPEQLQELIEYCVRPLHPEGHITFDQFVWMVTIRQRDIPIEEELRCALRVLDPDNTGAIDREYLREVVAKMGHKMIPKQVENFIKEVDMSNDGTIGVEDVVGTLCIDLNRDDIIMLQNQLNPPEEQNERTDLI